MAAVNTCWCDITIAAKLLAAVFPSERKKIDSMTKALDGGRNDEASTDDSTRQD